VDRTICIIFEQHVGNCSVVAYTTQLGRHSSWEKEENTIDLLKSDQLAVLHCCISTSIFHSVLHGYSAHYLFVRYCYCPLSYFQL